MAYIGTSPSQGVRHRYLFTATSGQTTFSGADDDSRTLSYTDTKFMDVFLNGVLLDPNSDYTATNGTSVVLTSGASAGDLLEVIAFDSFSVFSGTFGGDVTVGGAFTSQGIDDNASSTAVTIDGSGNVGIGTTTPNTLLDVESNTASEIRAIRDGGRSVNIYADGVNAILGYNTGELRIGETTSTISSNFTERMRIDSSGNLLIGSSSLSFDNVSKTVIRQVGDNWTIKPYVCHSFNRTDADGSILEFYKSSSFVGNIGADSVGIAVGAGDVGLYFRSSLDFIAPADPTTVGYRDNVIDLGYPSYRFDDIYATNGTIQTSDRNEKENIASMSDAEITAAKAISKLFKTFKWKDAVAEKGDSARTHAGVIAQDVQQAMADAGLDAGNYAFFISSTWWETQTEVPAVAEETDEEGNVIVEAKEAYTRTDTYHTAEETPEGATERTRLGIRYPELLAFIGAATEQRLVNIENRLEALENA